MAWSACSGRCLWTVRVGSSRHRCQAWSETSRRMATAGSTLHHHLVAASALASRAESCVSDVSDRENGACRRGASGCRKDRGR
uniref:Uncharacterized protein n=1 Tax=Arundo donax TaxID=35708 RepID=A0A0A9EU65_ARUDO